MDRPQNSLAAVKFFMSSSVDHSTGISGIATFIVRIQKDAGFIVATGVVSECGFGWYQYAPVLSDFDTLGDTAFHIEPVGVSNVDFADFKINVTDNPADAVLQMAKQVLAGDLLACAEWDGSLAFTFNYTAQLAEDATITLTAVDARAAVVDGVLDWGYEPVQTLGLFMRQGGFVKDPTWTGLASADGLEIAVSTGSAQMYKGIFGFGFEAQSVEGVRLLRIGFAGQDAGTTRKYYVTSDLNLQRKVGQAWTKMKAVALYGK